MRLSGWSVPIPHLSASSIALLISCPEQYRLRKIKKIPESRGIDKFIGSVDHAVHARNFSQKIGTGEDLNNEWMNGLYRAEWDKEISQDGEPDWAGAEPEPLRDHGQLVMQTYHQQVSPTVSPTAVETRFEERLPGVPVPVIGYVDIEETTRLIERKTTKTRVSKPKPQWFLQGRLYNMAFDKPVEWQIITRQATPQIVLCDTEPALRLSKVDKDGTVLIVQQATEMLQDFWTRYGPNSPWPTHGLLHPFQCGYCGFGPKYGNQCIAWR